MMVAGLTAPWVSAPPWTIPSIIPASMPILPLPFWFLCIVATMHKDLQNLGHLGLHQALGRPQRHLHTLLHPPDLVPCWKHWLLKVSSVSQTCSFWLLASTVAVPLPSSDMSWSTTLPSEWYNHSCFHVSSSCYTWSSGPCSQTSLTTAATPGVGANASRGLAPLLSRRPSRAPWPARTYGLFHWVLVSSGARTDTACDMGHSVPTSVPVQSTPGMSKHLRPSTAHHLDCAPRASPHVLPCS